MQQYPPVYGPPPRRDRTALIVGIAAGVFVVVVLIVVAVIIVISRSGPDEPNRLRSPLGIQPVTEVTPGACTDGSGVPDVDGTQCYRLAPGMTVTRLEKLEAALAKNGAGWQVLIELGPADSGAFGSLTRQVATEQPPRNQLALVVDGKVLSAPSVQEPITGGEIQITTGSSGTRQDAERLVSRLTHAD
ncbi:SecDF P1 head subdomain-containing protein [Actinomadura sp. HBU206391]|uniref:SecDF P1 head subdomain-containing protein n=1 Tax=Actinomadura sp. HBU206391 TaxID=2731692 RepID=UPI001650ACA9|nr:hypothetical protein [Actinomadura sp. HBU206391]MBC6457726.1 hypothetical protein [Actinomadura sp. HBU206391]